MIFDQLSRESIYSIIDLELEGFYHRVKELGYTLTLSDEAKNFIASKGYDVQFGARPLKRAIQKYLEDELAELLLGSEIQPGSDIVVDYDATTGKIVSRMLPANDVVLPDANE